MAYDSTIPALSNLISNDIPAMQENFSLLESAQVVDEGSTADGDYIRYENGWQICFCYNEFLNTSVDESTGSLYRSSRLNINTPVDFQGRIHATHHVSGDTEFNYAWIGGLAEQDALTFEFWRATSRSENDFSLVSILIGRWK